MRPHNMERLISERIKDYSEDIKVNNYVMERS